MYSLLQVCVSMDGKFWFFLLVYSEYITINRTMKKSIRGYSGK